MQNKISKTSTIGVRNNVKNQIKALAILNGSNTICSYMQNLIEQQVRQLSSAEYQDYRRFLFYFEHQNNI